MAAVYGELQRLSVELEAGSTFAANRTSHHSVDTKSHADVFSYAVDAKCQPQSGDLLAAVTRLRSLIRQHLRLAIDAPPIVSESYASHFTSYTLLPGSVGFIQKFERGCLN